MSTLVDLRVAPFVNAFREAGFPTDTDIREETEVPVHVKTFFRSNQAIAYFTVTVYGNTFGIAIGGRLHVLDVKEVDRRKACDGDHALAKHIYPFNHPKKREFLRELLEMMPD